MTEENRPTFLRRKLGAKLRRMREQAGLTLDQACPKLDRKRTSLHRVETGETRADVHLVKSMMDIYDIFDPDILNEAREAMKPPWFKPYGVKNMGYVDVETEAARVNEFALIVLPGLLQTEAYIKALFDKGQDRTSEQLAKDVALRLIRRERLTGEDRPLELVAIIDEAALVRQIGGREVMREQLRHLVQMASLPTVSIQVIPLGSGAHSALDGAFILLEFPDPEDPELLYVEYPTGAIHIEDQEEVRAAKLVFEGLRTAALASADSVVLIERLARELYGA